MSTRGGFDADKPYRVPDHVSVRREPFGALMYDHDSRKLLFLRGDPLRTVVEHLGEYPSASAAVARLAPSDGGAVIRSLERLAAGGLIRVAD